MIQRIQTLFLLVAAVLSASLLFGNLMEMHDVFGNSYVMTFKSVTVDIDGKTQVQNILPVAITVVAVPFFCLLSVFLFRKRNLQMKTTMAALLLSLGSLFVAAWFVIMLGKKVDLTYIWNAKATFPVIDAILCWLAYRAIRKDEEKVKSLDRIR